LLKKIIKKILNPEQRDWFRYRIVKINYYLNNFYKTYSFKLPFSKNKIDYGKLNKIINQDSSIFFFYYYYNKFFGSYKNINYFRNCCLKILANSNNNTLINSKINSCLELGWFKKIRNILKNKKISYNNKEKVNIFLKVVSNQNFNKKNVFNLKRKENTKYFNLINKKRIALVGPCKEKGSYGREIDKFDIIIRTNFTDVIKLEKDKTGMRTDVTYYNDSYWLDHRNKIIELNSNIWKNFKSEKFYEEFKKATKKNANSRAYDKLDFLYNLKSGCHLITIILFDILLFKPKIVKLFNFNLYNKGSSYLHSYQTLRKEKTPIDNIIGKELRHHDPIYNFNIFKKIIKSKKVFLDDNLKKYVAYNNIQYAKNLDKHFGKFTY
jgi:hypothetical protein